MHEKENNRNIKTFGHKSLHAVFRTSLDVPKVGNR